MELKNTVSTDSEASTDFARYTLIRVSGGVVFKPYGSSTFTFYQTADYGVTTSVVTWSTNSVSVGTEDATVLTLIQERDSWSDFDAASSATPEIYGVQNDGYILRVSYSSATLTVASSIEIPCTQALPAGAVCNSMHLTLDPSLMDFGRKMMVVLSPIDCSAVTSSTGISGPSARFYVLDTVPDVDVSPADTFIDGTESTDPTTGITTGTSVDYLKGWTCVDMPFSTSWTVGSQAWTYT